jgi:hypothetical protein
LLLACQSNSFVDNGPYKIPLTSVGTNYIQHLSPLDSESQYYSKNIAGLGGRDVYGGSVVFDGSGDYLSIPANAAFNFGSKDFTIECWVNMPSFPATVYFAGQTNSSDYAPVITFFASGKPGLAATTASGSWTINSSGSAPTLSVNVWYHIAWVRYGNEWSIYVNGTKYIIAASTAMNAYISTDPFGIGSEAVATINYPYVGFISNFRIVNGTAVYTGNFTPPTAPVLTYGKAEIYPNKANVNTTFSASNTSLLLNFTDAAIYDATKSTNYYTVGNTGVVTANSKFGGTSMYFDGSGDYLVSSAAASSPQYAFGSSDFTIEMWVYPTAYAATSATIYDTRPAPSATAVAYQIIYISSAGVLAYTTQDAGGPTISGGSVGLNTWSHVAVTRTAANTKLFLNGNQVGSTYSDSRTYITGANRPIIGTDGNVPNSAGYNYIGYIDDLRVTANARYTANFTPAISTFFTQ